MAKNTYKNVFEMKESCYKIVKELVSKGLESLEGLGSVPGEEVLERLSDLSQQLEDIRDNMHMLICEEHVEYYFAVASLAALRSKDPSTPVGACIVDPNKRIVGIGYNSMPYRDKKDNDDKYPWGNKMCADCEVQGSKRKYLCAKTKYPYVCHAALNAIVSRVIPSLEGCTIYLTIHPDEDCALLIVQSGIKEVIYSEVSVLSVNEGEQLFQNAKDILQSGGIRLRKCIPKFTPQLSVTKTNLQKDDTTADRRTQAQKELSLESRIMNRRETLDRNCVIFWDELFISLAMLEKAFTNQKDKSPTKKQGVCIVSSSNQILAIGGSMLSPGIDYSTMQSTIGGSIDGDPLVCHAEFRAITTYKGTVPLKDCKLYVTLSPCNVCAKLIAQSGIKKVFYKEPIDTPWVKESFHELSKTIFKNSEIECSQVKTVETLKLCYQKDRFSYSNVYTAPTFSQHFKINVRCTEENCGVLQDEKSLLVTTESIFEASSIGCKMYPKIQLHSFNMYFNASAVASVCGAEIYSVRRDEPFYKEVSTDFKESGCTSGKVVRLSWKWWTTEICSTEEVRKVCSVLFETDQINNRDLDLKIDFEITFFSIED